MKFLRIKYKNYRCFIDAELSFKTDEKKNIALIVAPNGGGKTEMLFSFWWVLYNFNFKDLKGKEDT
ncbi:MAG: AAA family ATPase, partial [Anaeroplasmataceae bacterium]|nr:AAA family ATPase [Anaeroplasmataceae bacterium]